MDRQFPPEVVVLIVEASLDPYDSFDLLDDHIPRYSTLCSYSRLNSVWRNISKPLLYESVVITTDKTGEALLEVLEREKGEELGMVRSLRVSDSGGADADVIERLVHELCNQVESLALEAVGILHLPIANRLRRLFLRQSSFGPPSAPADPSVLPQLQHLEIAGRFTDFDLGTPQSLPSLRSLSLTSTETTDIAPALFNTLTALHLDDEDTCRRFLPHAKNLLLLSISNYFSDDVAFSRFDTIPRFVRLAQHSLSDAVTALEYHVSSGKSGLETILWDEEADHDEDEPDECEARIAGQVRLLSGKGIKVIRGNISFRDAVERVDAILAKEKRAAECKERAAM